MSQGSGLDSRLCYWTFSIDVKFPAALRLSLELNTGNILTANGGRGISLRTYVGASRSLDPVGLHGLSQRYSYQVNGTMFHVFPSGYCEAEATVKLAQQIST
jgi:hypothetical protein